MQRVVCWLFLGLLACSTDPENQAPEVAREIPDQELRPREEQRIDLTPVFADPDGDTLSYTVESADPGVEASIGGTHLHLLAGTRATEPVDVVVTAADPDGLSATDALQVTVVNRPPGTVGEIPDLSILSLSDSSFSVVDYFDDPDGDDLEYEVTSESSDVAEVRMGGNGTLTVMTKAVRYMPTTVTVTATDLGGETATQGFEVEALNRPPELVRELPDVEMQRGRDMVVELGDHFMDPEGDTLVYRASSGNPSVATVSIEGSGLSVSAVAVGSAEVAVEVIDSYEDGVSASFPVTVLPVAGQEWRENFDSVEALDYLELVEPDDGYVEVGEDAGTLLLHLPTVGDYDAVIAVALEAVDIDVNWVASTHMGLKSGGDEMCPQVYVATDSEAYPAFKFEIDANEEVIAYVLHDDYWHRIYDGGDGGWLDDGPYQGDYFDWSVSLPNDSTMIFDYNDGDEVFRFDPRDDWPGDGSVPTGATGVGVGGEPCYDTGVIEVDFMEIKARGG